MSENVKIKKTLFKQFILSALILRMLAFRSNGFESSRET